MACQLSLLTAAPVSLLAHMPQAADAITCTCVHGGAGECPMHHPAKKKSGCECRNTTDPDAASLVSLLGPIAVLNAPANLEPPAITKLPDYPITRFVSVAAPLASPPPRA
jgi:hypothetical protein